MFLVAASVCTHEVHAALVHSGRCVRFQGMSSNEVGCDLMFCHVRVLNAARKCGVFLRMKIKCV